MKTKPDKNSELIGARAVLWEGIGVAILTIMLFPAVLAMTSGLLYLLSIAAEWLPDTL